MCVICEHRDICSLNARNFRFRLPSCETWRFLLFTFIYLFCWLCSLYERKYGMFDCEYLIYKCNVLFYTYACISLALVRSIFASNLLTGNQSVSCPLQFCMLGLGRWTVSVTTTSHLACWQPLGRCQLQSISVFSGIRRYATRYSDLSHAHFEYSVDIVKLVSVPVGILSPPIGDDGALVSNEQ